MAEATLLQTSFLGGQWSQRMQGRIDRPDYRTAMNVCLNSFPVETGAWVRRPGTRFAGLTRRGVPGRLIKFDFEAEISYNMVFTDNVLRFYVGARPAFNLTGNVSTISTADPAVVTFSPDPGFNSGAAILFANLGAVAPLLQNREFFIQPIGGGQYSLEETINLSPIDGSTLNWVAGTQATASQIVEFATPYTGGAWEQVRSVQTDTVAFLLHPTIAPRAVVVLTAPTATQDATFNLANAVFNDGPYLDPNSSTVNGYSGTSGTINVSTTVWSPGFQAGDVGRLLRFFCEPAVWDGGNTYGTLGTYVKYNGTYWVQSGTSGSGNFGQPGASQNWSPVTGVTLWTWAIITAVNSATSVTVNIQGSPIPTTFSNGSYVINIWRLGVYGGANGYPTCGTYHEGRLWLGGAVPNRWDASVANGINGAAVNFAPTATDGSVAANNAISYVFNAPDAEPIFWMTPDLQGVIAGTKSGEWLIQPPSPGAMSPTNIAARRVTKVGCANIEPRRTEHTIVFVQAAARKLMEYFADAFSGKLTGPHLSVTWKPLTIGGIDEIAYQQEFAPLIWLRVAGGLVSATYKRDTLLTSQGPSFSAGAPHKLGSARTIESICVGPSEDGTTEALALITNDAANVRHIEIMTDIQDEGTPIGDYWLLDDAVNPSSTVTTNVPSTGAPYGGLTLNGLWHLNGKTATVFAGGLDCGDYLVANGSVFVPYGDSISAGTAGGKFTAAFVQGDPNIIVGFTYNSDGQIVRPATPAESGARTGPALGKLRRPHKYGMLVETTCGGVVPETLTPIGLQIGTTFSKLDPVLFKDLGTGKIAAPGQSYTGVVKTTLTADYSFDEMLCWRVSRPLPANIAAVTAFLETQDE